MENTLIIYDDNGKIFTQITGDYIKPEGLQHLEIEVSQGKFITGVDVSVAPHQAILEDIPPSEIDVLKARQDATENALLDMLMSF